MALSGTLSDLGIVDLIQFPGTGKKTGELVIAGVDDEARLFYEQGKLKHVTCGEKEGLDGLIDLVSWEEGEFEFRLGSTTDSQSMEIDLHRALMVALKTRDERREEARKQAMVTAEQSLLEKTTVIPPNGNTSTVPPTRVENPQMQKILAEVASSFAYIEYAAVFHRNGSQVCLWSRDDVDIQIYTQIVTSVSDVFGSHPRKELQKVYLTDNLGTCIGFAVGQNYLLFLAAAEESSLGVVSVAASKIATAISGEGE